MKIKDFLANSPLIPVLTIHNLEDAIPLAKALMAGGLNTLEITLRTSLALEALQTIHAAFPHCTLAAGTVTQAKQLAEVKAAGASFAVSPGITASLLTEAQKVDCPLLPGVATPSEALLAIEYGYAAVKFFPAELSGGIKKLNTFASVFPPLQFCPTGGISLDNLTDYLALPNVISVGGTWLGPQDLIEKKDWAAITELARQASDIISKQ